jgi:hypothetical protein
MKRPVVVLVIMLFFSIGIRGGEIQDLELVLENGYLIISFRVTDCFDSKVIEELRSGVMTEFTYVVEIRKEKKILPDPVKLKKRIRVVSALKTIENTYDLTIKVGDEIFNIYHGLDLETMKRRMTEMDNLKFHAGNKLKSNAKYILAVQAIFEHKYKLLIFPSHKKSKWKVKRFIYRK